MGKYVERCQKSMHEQEMEVLQEIVGQYRDQRLNLLSTINYLDPSCAREEAMMEKVIRFKKVYGFLFLEISLLLMKIDFQSCFHQQLSIGTNIS